LRLIYLSYRFAQKGLRENGKPNLVLDLMRATMNVLTRFDTSNPMHPKNDVEGGLE
jgi:hypothetical protein